MKIQFKEVLHTRVFKVVPCTSHDSVVTVKARGIKGAVVRHAVGSEYARGSGIPRCCACDCDYVYVGCRVCHASLDIISDEIKKDR
jgi:hypothetical protein